MPSARILIVEDERQTVDELRDLFELYGYETEVALNSQVAISILQERCMDIAIISTSVQGVPGTEILHEIKKYYATMPIIMISDQKLKRIEISSMKAGATVFLLKPLDRTTILQTIEDILVAPVALAIKPVALAIKKKTKPFSKSRK